MTSPSFLSHLYLLANLSTCRILNHLHGISVVLSFLCDQTVSPTSLTWITGFARHRRLLGLVTPDTPSSVASPTPTSSSPVIGHSLWLQSCANSGLVAVEECDGGCGSTIDEGDGRWHSLGGHWKRKRQKPSSGRGVGNKPIYVGRNVWVRRRAGVDAGLSTLGSWCGGKKRQGCGEVQCAVRGTGIADGHGSSSSQRWKILQGRWQERKKARCWRKPSGCWQTRSHFWTGRVSHR